MTKDTGRNVSKRNKGKSRNESDSGVDKSQQPAHRVRLPGFITDDEIGLGDAIQRATSYFGIPTCGGYQRRAATLNLHPAALEIRGTEKRLNREFQEFPFLKPLASLL